MGSHKGPIDRFSEMLLTAARWALGGRDTEWVDALRAELPEFRTSRERLSWSEGVAGMVAFSMLNRLVERPLLLVLAALAGALIGLIDLSSDVRWPQLAGLAAVAATFGWRAPNWPWRWGLVVGLGVPLAVLSSLSWGPYEYDHLDALYALPVTVVAAFAGAGVRRLGRLWASTA